MPGSYERRSVALARWIVLGAAIAGGCGQEEIQLLKGGDGGDAAESQGQASSDASLGERTPADGAVTTDVSTESTPACLAAGASRVCRENGTTCVIDAECCSSRCAVGVCLEPGSCAGPGTACTTRDDCCSGRCEPVVGTTNQTCLNYCLSDGAACTRALDCCSMGCHAGSCGAPLCGAVEAPCAGAADCCSGVCSASEGTCEADEADTVCRATGEACRGQEGGANGAGGVPCCGACDTSLGRCDFGPGPCLPSGALCVRDTDCCRGTCADGPNGVSTCTAPCLVDGTACASGDACCNGHCIGAPGMCGLPTTCNLLGAACTADAQCCSGQCLDGVCGTSCPMQ